MVKRNFRKIAVDYRNLNSSVKFCRRDGCERVFWLQEVDNLQKLMNNTQAYLQKGQKGQCSCGFFYCWDCEEEKHAPCSCEQTVQWNSKNQLDNLST